MSLWVAAILCLCVASEAHWPVGKDGESVPVPPTFDCSMRWLAYEYGTKLAVRELGLL